MRMWYKRANGMNPYDTEYELLLSIKVFMIIFRVRLNTIAFLFVYTENEKRAQKLALSGKKMIKKCRLTKIEMCF